HARDRAAHARGAPAMDGHARGPASGGGGGQRRAGRRVGQAQLVQPAPGLRQRGGPVRVRRARLARPRSRARTPRAPAAPGHIARLPQDGARHLPLQRGGRCTLPEDGFHAGRGVARAGAAGRPLGRRPHHGAPALSHGWTVVAALSVTEIVSWGIMYYGFPVFLASMERDLDASRVAIAGAFTVGMAVAALAALPVGRWLDAGGAGGLLTLGSCLGTALMVAWAQVHSVRAPYAGRIFQ